MNRQFAPQVETQRVPSVGLQPAMHLAVHALRAVLERPEDFLAAFFSLIEKEQPPCSLSKLHLMTSHLTSSLMRSVQASIGNVSAAAIVSWDPLQALVPMTKARSQPVSASSVPTATVEAVITADDSQLGGAGEWGCAVTPPLSLTDETFALPGLLLEQAS